jgi:hypothetical protein
MEEGNVFSLLQILRVGTKHLMLHKQVTLEIVAELNYARSLNLISLTNLSFPYVYFESKSLDSKKAIH